MSNRYDEVPYTSHPYARTHPDRLATLARLFGLQPPSPTTARVLELGCASGGNLLPMAELLPQARFVGVDLSARQIERARELAAAAQLGNLELHAASILDVDERWGQFDYVICHGVYSWVPREVQEKILAICRERLSSDGIAFISYNTYPGWRMREMVRDMMRWHVRGIASPAAAIDQARALVDFLARSVAGHDHQPHALQLRKELALLEHASDDYLFHEHLEECNQPLYFHEFVDRLAQHGLRYLCESDLHTMLSRELSDDVRRTLDRIAPDLVHMEQYLDFVRNRQFRASLVCHGERTPHRALSPARMHGLRFGLPPTAAGEAIDLWPGVVHSFVDAEERRISSGRSITKAALACLQRSWPRELDFATLHARAATLLRESGIAISEGAESELAADLLECVISGSGLDVRCEPCGAPTALPQRPWAPAVARAQARSSGAATSLRHQRVALDGFGIELLAACDGTRDHAGLLAKAMQLLARGAISVVLPEGVDVSPQRQAAALADAIERTLAQLHRSSLLADGGPP